MSDTVYNVRHYIKFTADEFISLIATSFFAGFILTFNEWGSASLDVMAGIQSWALMFVFLLFIILVTVWICKAVAIRIGYTVTYHAHIVGLLLGVFLCVASAGYLPLFLPGGFSIEQPQRLKIGKWHAHYRVWEVGLVSSTFSLVMLLWVMFFNPLFLFTRSPFYLHMIIATCLIALYALIPAPFISLHHGGMIKDWWRYFKGSTFGLELLYNSRVWYTTVVATVLLFTALAYILTLVGFGVGIAIYIISLVLAGIGAMVYHRFLSYNA